MSIAARSSALLALLALAACTGSAAPAAPVLDDVAPFDGMLYLTWYTPELCDTVSGERKDESHPVFAEIFSVAGTETSKIDQTATLDTTYTYRLRCAYGDEVSAYSATLSANPVATP